MTRASHLFEVLRAAPIGCGRYNNIDWPCGVVVMPIGCWATLGSAYVITTRMRDAFAPGALRSADAASGTPYHVLALQTALNEKSGSPKYIHIHRFGIAHQNEPANEDAVEMMQWMGSRPFAASPRLLDALGPRAYDPQKYRYVFFRM
tara:strand:+ start:164 stop:607 length:444 start_codon:yes stop_codon:yes gene_type:complete